MSNMIKTILSNSKLRNIIIAVVIILVIWALYALFMPNFMS